MPRCLAGLVATPIAAFADTGPALDPIPAGIPSDAVVASADPDGAGTLFTLTHDVTTTSTIAMPNDATLAGAGHTITAVEDADHANFPGAVLASAVGTDAAPAGLDVANLHIATQGFQGDGKNSGGLLAGISMYRAGGSLTDVSVDGVSHGNGVQEGTAISIRNRVSGDDIDVPRAHVTLDGVEVSNFQKAGLLLDGNLAFVVNDAHVGQGSGPDGQPNPTIAANSLQVSRGASGTVSHSSFALNSHEEAAGVLLYNARRVAFSDVDVNGDAAATSGIYVWNTSNTIETAFTMQGGSVTRTATPAAGTGVTVDGPADSITATLIDTSVTGWDATDRRPGHAGHHGRRDAAPTRRRVPRPTACASSCRHSSSRSTRSRASSCTGSSRSTATAAPASISTPARTTSGPSGSARAPAPTRSRSSRTA